MSALPATFSTRVLFKLGAVQQTSDAFDTLLPTLLLTTHLWKLFQSLGVLHFSVFILLNFSWFVVLFFFLNKFNETHI